MQRTDCQTEPIAFAPTMPNVRNSKALVLALAATAQGMVGLDLAIVNVALPTIQRDLGMSQGALQWIVVAYGLILGGFLLLGGRLTDQLGRRRIFVTGLTIFTFASLLGGIAMDARLLILARAVQGFSSALIAPAALSLLAVTFSEGRERDRAFGLFGAIVGIAASVGVVVGGLLTAGPGWRWAFLMNIPAGLLCIALALVLLAADRPAGRTGHLDANGATTVTGGLMLFVYALHHASGHGWTSGSTMLLFAAAVALLSAFTWIESRSSAPLLPLSTLRNRAQVAANVTAFVTFGVLSAFIFLGTLLMQQVLAYSPLQTGVAWLATTVTIFPASVIGTRSVARIGVRRMMGFGLVLLVIGSLWMVRVPANGNYLIDLLPAFIIAGLGFGLCGPALQIGAMAGVAKEDSGLAAGLVETMREIGAAAGVAVISSALVSRVGLAGFHVAFAVISVSAVLGLAIVAIGFPRSAREAGEMEQPVAGEAAS